MSSRKAAAVSLPPTLRDALYDLVHHSPLPAKAQAEILNKSYSYLCNAANPDLEEFNYQLRDLVPHTRATDNYAVVDYIERILGRVAVPIRNGAAPAPADLRQAMLRICQEMGEAAGALEQSLRDDSLTQDETAHCRKELWDLIREAATLHDALERR